MPLDELAKLASSPRPLLRMELESIRQLITHCNAPPATQGSCPGKSIVVPEDVYALKIGTSGQQVLASPTMSRSGNRSRPPNIFGSPSLGKQSSPELRSSRSNTELSRNLVVKSETSPTKSSKHGREKSESENLNPFIDQYVWGLQGSIFLFICHFICFFLFLLCTLITRLGK